MQRTKWAANEKPIRKRKTLRDKKKSFSLFSFSLSLSSLALSFFEQPRPKNSALPAQKPSPPSSHLLRFATMNASPMLEDKPAPASPLRGGAGDDKNGGQTATTPQSKTKTAPSRGASPSIATPAARASSSRATKTKPEPASPPEAKATEEKKKRGRPAAAKKATEEEKGKGKAAAPKSKAAEGKKNKEATIPGWNIDGEILWK